jgi:outer membrane protein assembly factor BamB
MNLRVQLLVSLALIFTSFSRAQKNPWPQFLGATRDAVYHGDDLAADWPKEGPRVLWQVNAGEGFSGPIVADGKVILFQRIDAEEVVECLDWMMGKPLWKLSYPTKFKDGIRADNGPRSTPTMLNGRIYTYGAEGELHCLDAKTGSKIWHVSGKKEFNVTPRWHGVACSPLLEGNAVILNIGNTNDAGIVAFNKENGEVLWKSTKHKVSCSSPIATTIGGRRYLITLSSRSLTALDPATGKELFTDTLDAKHKDHLLAACPIVIDDLVFASGAYNVGGHLLRVKDGKKESVWKTAELATQYATPIAYDGHLYGVHGQWEAGVELRCIDLEKGELKWSRPDYKESTVLRAGDELFVLTYTGMLVRGKLSPKEFKETARAQVSSFGVRAYPALADGLFYLRTKNKLVCLDLRKKI